jgi:hypothetical protein
LTRASLEQLGQLTNGSSLIFWIASIS